MLRSGIISFNFFRQYLHKARGYNYTKGFRRTEWESCLSVVHFLAVHNSSIGDLVTHWLIALGDNPFFIWMNIFFEWMILDFLEWIIFWMNNFGFFWMNKFFEWIFLLYDWMNYWMNNKKCTIHKKNNLSLKKVHWKAKLQDFLTKPGLFQDNFSYFTVTYFTSKFE